MTDADICLEITFMIEKLIENRQPGVSICLILVH